jgi:hypothetical protein
VTKTAKEQKIKNTKQIHRYGLWQKEAREPRNLVEGRVRWWSSSKFIDLILKKSNPKNFKKTDSGL